LCSSRFDEKFHKIRRLCREMGFEMKVLGKWNGRVGKERKVEK
jgi:hypothetical protein